jgi:ABC-type polysaccharide/polyol phosphate transport system ATPase subunit
MRSVEVDSVSKRFVLGRSSYATLRDDVMWALRPRRPAVSRELDLWALRDVSFEVDDGEVVGIIGHNGAGKSTLLRILARITEPTSGASRTRGRVGALLDVGTGFHPELSGRENVFLSGAILGLRRSEIRRRFDDIVSFAGIEKFLDTPIKRYSSGMYLRLAFSVAAHLEPDVVVVDEILAVGDAEFQRRSLGRMSEFANEGRTVLFVSHDLGAVSRICGRVIWMDQGTIRHDGPVARGIEAYLGAHGGQASYVELPFDEHLGATTRSPFAPVCSSGRLLADSTYACTSRRFRASGFSTRACWTRSETDASARLPVSGRSPSPSHPSSPPAITSSVSRSDLRTSGTWTARCCPSDSCPHPTSRRGR